jgi:hypothetical protein
MLMKRIHKCGFSDARLASDKNDLSMATQGFLEGCLKFTKRTCAANHRRGWAMRGIVRGLRDMVRDWRDELIAPLGKSFDEHRIVMLIAQHFANAQNVFLDEFRIYVCLRPEGFQKFILRYQASRVLHQITQYIEGLWGKRYPVLTAPKAMVRRIKPECLENLHAAPFGCQNDEKAGIAGILRQYQDHFTCLLSEPPDRGCSPVTEIRLKSDVYVTFSFPGIRILGPCEARL